MDLDKSSGQMTVFERQGSEGLSGADIACGDELMMTRCARLITEAEQV